MINLFIFFLKLPSSPRQITPSILSSNLNPISHSPPIPGKIRAVFFLILSLVKLFTYIDISYSADISKDQRQRQFLSTMRQHREQLVVYLDSLKQALNSLDRIASVEPTRSEIHLANMK